MNFFGRLLSAAKQLDKNNNQISSSRQDGNTKMKKKKKKIRKCSLLYKEEISSAIKPVEDYNHDKQKSKLRSECLYFLPSLFFHNFFDVS